MKGLFYFLLTLSLCMPGVLWAQEAGDDEGKLYGHAHWVVRVRLQGTLKPFKGNGEERQVWLEIGDQKSAAIRVKPGEPVNHALLIDNVSLTVNEHFEAALMQAGGFGTEALQRRQLVFNDLDYRLVGEGLVLQFSFREVP